MVTDSSGDKQSVISTSPLPLGAGQGDGGLNQAPSVGSLPARPRSSLRSLLLKCLLAVTVTLLSAEGVMRVYVAQRGWTANCYAAQLELFRPNSSTGCDLRPGFRLKSSVYEISINSLGLRGPEITHSKPKGVQRIVIVGESSAFGYLVSDGQEAARLLERGLRQHGHNVEVLNGSVPGYNLFHSLARFREVLAPLEPDLVIAYLGWNDLPYAVSAEPNIDRFRRRPVPAAWERALGHSTLYGFLVYRLWGGPVRMVPADFAHSGVTQAGERQFLDNLAALASEVERAGAKLIICAQATAAHPSLPADLRAALGPGEARQAKAIEVGEWLHRTLADFAAERTLPFVDAYSNIPATAEMLADYVHLTAAGERRLAELWEDAVARLVSGRVGAAGS